MNNSSAVRWASVILVLLAGACRGGGASSPSDAPVEPVPSDTAPTATASQTAPTATASQTTPTATASATTTAAPITEASILGAWQNHHEKSEAGLEIYVRQSEPLPPSRFRRTFAFEAGGKAKVLCLSPSDAHAVREGTWKLAGDVLTIEVKCFLPEVTTMRYRVARATASELALASLP